MYKVRTKGDVAFDEINAIERKILSTKQRCLMVISGISKTRPIAIQSCKSINLSFEKILSPFFQKGLLGNWLLGIHFTLLSHTVTQNLILS